MGGKGIPQPASRDGIAWDDARLVIHNFQRAFGQRFFLEVQPFWELEKTQKINTAYARLSREAGVPLVVTPDIHYTHPEKGEIQAILHAVHRGKHSIDDALREWNYSVPMTYPESDADLGERLMKTGLTRNEAWEAICMTAEIADRINFRLPKAERLIYPISESDLEPWLCLGGPEITSAP